MPLKRSLRRRNISSVVNNTTENSTRIVAAERIVGLISWRIPDHICSGKVCCFGPPTNRIMTISSNDVMNANRAPEIIPGAINGICILKKL